MTAEPRSVFARHLMTRPHQATLGHHKSRESKYRISSVKESTKLLTIVHLYNVIFPPDKEAPSVEEHSSKRPW